VCVFDYLRLNFKTQKNEKPRKKREVRSHNKVREIFTENEVRFARAEQI